MPLFDIPGMPGAQMGAISIGDIFVKLGGGRSKTRRVTVQDSHDILINEESDKLLDTDQLTQEAIKAVENNGIVFLDEIDKICVREGRVGADVSREGVQRDLLPLIEGTTVATKHGADDPRDHLMPANQRPHHVCARVAELGDQDEIKDVKLAVPLQAGEKVDLLDEIEQPWHIHQPHQRHRDGCNPRARRCGKELAHAQSEHKQDQEQRFKVIDPRRRIVDAQPPLEMGERAQHEQRPAHEPRIFETRQPALFRHPIKFHQPRESQRGD